jgi:hypothetical protein
VHGRGGGLLGIEPGRLREVTRRGLVFLTTLIACGGSSPEPAAAPATSAATGTPGAAAAANNGASGTGPFDRAAAAKALAAVDVKACYEKPPALDAQLHIDLTFMPNGVVSEATADAPYANTEAGKCAEEKFRAVRVPPYDGPPVRMGRTVPHAPVRGRAEDGKFDPSAVRSAALAQDISECLDLPGGGVEKGKATISVQPSGDVRTVYVDPPLGGSPRGECVARIYKSVQYKPYAGDPAPGVLVEFEFKKKR